MSKVKKRGRGKPFQKGHKINVGIKHSKERIEKQKQSLLKHYKENPVSEITKEKMRKSHIGEKNHNWKGDKAKVLAMHEWVERQRGKASEHQCVDCGKQAQHWSNKDHS